MDEWQRIRRFFLNERSAKEKGDRLFLTVRGPQRSQIVGLRFTENAEVAVESPFAKMSELTRPLSEVLPLISAESRFGFRVEDGYLILTSLRHIAFTNPVELDRLVADLGMEADCIEMLLSDKDGF